jgi:hypothetical protein
VVTDAPDAATLHDALVQALAALGVTHAGHAGDLRRWSHTDLATDLAPLLARLLEEAR